MTIPTEAAKDFRMGKILAQSLLMPMSDHRYTQITIWHHDLKSPKYLKIGEPYTLKVLANALRQLAEMIDANTD